MMYTKDNIKSYYMTTKLVGFKDFRQNLASYAKTVKNGEIRLIVLRKNIPVLEVNAINEKTFALEKLALEIAEAREQVKKGQVYTQKEIMEEFGLL